MERTILHVDANCFYASVEAAQNPSLNHYPFAVAGDGKARRGVILAANYLAKRRFGIQTGEPVIRALAKCPFLITVPSRFSLYMDYSQKLRSILLDYTDLVEPFGCDEAWMDVTGSRRLFGNGVATAQQIRQRVKDELGITVSIGVSFNKPFSKIGSDYRKPDAVTVITQQAFRDIVWPLPAESLLYVGKSTLKKLNLRGIYTIGDLAQSHPPLLKACLGKLGIDLYQTANGLDTTPVSSIFSHKRVKSISNRTTLPRDLSNTEEVKAVLATLCQSVARRARKKQLFGKTVFLSVRDNTLHTFTRQCTLEQPTSLSGEILDAAMMLFQKSYTWHRAIRSLGIGLSDLCEGSAGLQLSLFDDERRRKKQEALETVQDTLIRQFGPGCITRGLALKHPDITGFCPKDTTAFSS